MKRQKRDRVSRAFSRGYHAGLSGKSQDLCPFDALDHRASWINGWREGRTDHLHGYRGIASIQHLKV
ncbi:ribosome modulation factor [Isoalcanivorax beigongshangi]|uniref:Ribosome modulation factor n=1 Tax=Isoalcanivorax beigongshangi TaxID=3238810 RepID=A0ABV4AGC9_9GAMM